MTRDPWDGGTRCFCWWCFERWHGNHREHCWTTFRKDGCCQTFDNEALYASHKRFGYCMDPKEMGLVVVEGVWGEPELVRRLARNAGVGVDKLDPHSFQHSFVTAALDAGVSLRDAQDAADHAGPEPHVDTIAPPAQPRPRGDVPRGDGVCCW